MSKAIIGQKLIEQFKAAGLLPDMTSRIVIDIPCNDAVKVYYECFLDTEKLDLDLANSLNGGPFIRVCGRDK
jgi:hypothetical protein